MDSCRASKGGNETPRLRSIDFIGNCVFFTTNCLRSNAWTIRSSHRQGAARDAPGRERPSLHRSNEREPGMAFDLHPPAAEAAAEDLHRPCLVLGDPDPGTACLAPDHAVIELEMVFCPRIRFPDPHDPRREFLGNAPRPVARRRNGGHGRSACVPGRRHAAPRTAGVRRQGRCRPFRRDKIVGRARQAPRLELVELEDGLETGQPFARHGEAVAGEIFGGIIAAEPALRVRRGHRREGNESESEQRQNNPHRDVFLFRVSARHHPLRRWAKRRGDGKSRPARRRLTSPCVT